MVQGFQNVLKLTSATRRVLGGCDAELVCCKLIAITRVTGDQAAAELRRLPAGFENPGYMYLNSNVLMITICKQPYENYTLQAFVSQTNNNNLPESKNQCNETSK